MRSVNSLDAEAVATSDEEQASERRTRVEQGWEVKRSLEQHQAALCRWARTLARHASLDADEIVQQVYLEVLEGRVNLKDSQDPRALLFGVARQLTRSRWRSLQRWASTLRRRQEDLHPDTPTPSPEQALQRSLDANRVRDAMEKLPARQLEVITLVFMEEQTIEAASRIMGISLGSARTHYHRAKQHLARTLEATDE